MLTGSGQFSPQEGDSLGAGHGHLGTEFVAAGAIRDTICHRPGDGAGIVGVCRHIVKAVSSDDRGARCPPLEGDCLRAGHRGVRAEGGSAGAHSDAICHRPQHRIVVPGVGADISKGVTAGVSPGDAPILSK